MKGQLSPSYYSEKSLKRVQEAALKILESSPSLIRELPTDSLLRPNVKQTLPYSSNLIHSTTLATEPSSDIYPLRKQSGTALQPVMISPKMSITQIEWQKKHSDLEAKYKKLERDFFTIKEEGKQKEQRYIKREEALRKMIRELEGRLQETSSGIEAEKQQEIANLHNSVLQKVGNIQTRTAKILIDQEKDIIRHFDTKVHEIKKEYDNEKAKYLESNANFSKKEDKLIAEMEWVKGIAQKIDTENQTLTKKYNDLKAQQVSKNEHDRMLKELVQCKRKNAILENQLGHYERIVQEYSQEKNIKLHTTGLETSQNLTVETTSPNILDASPNLTILDFGGEGSPIFNSSSTKNTQRSGLSLALRSSYNSKEPSPIRGSEGRLEGIVTNYKNTLQRERKQKQQLKATLIKELETKSELDKILRECIQEVKDSVAKIRKEKSSPKRMQTMGDSSGLDTERNMLVDKLINNERILALIYDKTFYARNRDASHKLPDFLLDTNDDDF